jgi:putative ABC transport system permease protein
MTKKLFNQIKNEWHSNLWLMAELLLVSVVMWFIVDYLYVQYSVYNQPRGFDTNHCYHIAMGTLSQGDTDYNPSDTVHMDDVEELMARLRRRPEIDAVSLSFISFPYNTSNTWQPVTCGNFKAENIFTRYVTPDFFRVFKIEGVRGESPEQLSKMLKEKVFMVTDDLYKDKYHLNMTSMIGKKFVLGGDSANKSTLIAAYKPMRYSDYMEASVSRSYIAFLPKKNYTPDLELCVRVKEGQDVDFSEKLWKDADKQLSVGNVYISNVESFSDIRKSFQQDDTNQTRNCIFGMGFLMLNIFLGLLGTFWFRTQQRRSELALFKALGATKGDVFVRQIMEGLLLLLIATIPAILIDANIAFAGLNQKMDGVTLAPGRFIITVVITWLLIAIMIVLGNWLPAKKAMSIQPARALHEE